MLHHLYTQDEYEKVTKDKVRYILWTGRTVDLIGPRARGKVGTIVKVIGGWRISSG